MNKKELSKAVAVKTGIQKGDAELIVDAVFDIISDTLEAKEFVNIIGFGKFDTKETSARTALNLKQYKELVDSGVSQEDAKEQSKIPVAAGRKPTFAPAKALKDKIKQ